jgi:glycosyltransferase involved in cell wall biosynthesis
MRIVFAVHAFPPRSTAGVEVHTLRLARALRARGHDVHVISAVHDLSDRPYAVRRREQDGVPVAEIVSVHPRGTLSATYGDDAIDEAARGLLQQMRPEVVHVQHLLNLSAGIVTEARRQGAVVALTLHDYWLSCPRDGLRMQADTTLCREVDPAVCSRCLADSPYLAPAIQRGLAKAVRGAGLGRRLHDAHRLMPGLTTRVLAWMRRANPRTDLVADLARRDRRLRETVGAVDAVFAPTRFVRDRMVEWGVPPRAVEVAPYGAIVAPTLPRPAGPRRRFGFLGTVAPHKGVHVLIEAFRGLDVPGVALDIHGSLSTAPAYVETLRGAAAGDARIRFHGPFAEGGQAEILAGLDAVVALAAGRPVIATRTGGVPEIVEEDVSAALVEPRDAEGLRAALADLAHGRRLAEPLAPLRLRTAADEAAFLEGRYAAALAQGPARR